MAAEVKKFRQLLYEWLKGDVSALTAEVGTRIYPVWPPIEAQYPCCAINISARESKSDYGAPNWGGEVEIRLFDPSEDKLDDLEDAIVDYVNANSTEMLGKLTDANTVETVSFVFLGTTQDVREAFESDRFLVITRVLRFNFAFVKREEGWT